MVRFWKMLILALMVFNGLLFVCNIYVLGDIVAAIEMHEDLAPTAGAFMVNTKVVICFIVGAAYLASAWAIARRRYRLALAGVIGVVVFDGFYILEIILWGKTYPHVWNDFLIFGGLSLIIGVFSFLNWKKVYA